MTILKKFDAYYKGLSAPLKASFWFVVCGVIVKSFSVISTPIFTRLLTVQQYGQTANFYSWYDLLFPFVTMYISGVAYNNVLVKYEEDRERATFSLMTLACLLSITCFILYLFARRFVTDILGVSPNMMCVMFLELMFVPIFDFWSAKERYDYKYKKLITLTLTSTIFSLILGVVLVVFSEHKYEMRVSSKIIITVIIGIILYFSAFKSSGYRLTTKYWKYAIIISIPLIPHYLSIKILHQVDRVMITNMVGLTQTGMYNLAAAVSGLMVIVTDSINRSMCPYVYRCIKSRDVSGVKGMTNGVLLLVLTVSFFEMLLAPELIKVFATKEYLDAIYVIPPLALSVYFIFLYVVFANVEFYFEKTIFATIVSVVAAVANIALNYLFIQYFGYYAAGFTSLVCYIIFTILHYLNYSRVKRLHPELNGMFDINMIVLISLMGILMMLLCIFLYSFPFIRLGIALLLIIIIFLKKKNILALATLKKDKTIK